MDGLGARVRRYRMQRQMTVRDLAKKAGVSVSYIYAIESGTRGHNINKLNQIAGALGVSLHDLWKEGDDR